MRSTGIQADQQVTIREMRAQEITTQIAPWAIGIQHQKWTRLQTKIHIGVSMKIAKVC